MMRRANPWLVALGFIGMADMVFTACGLALGVLEELNPLLNWVYTHYGLNGFIFVKSVAVIVPVGVVGLCWDRVPRSQAYTVFGTVAYVGILGIGIVLQF